MFEHLDDRQPPRSGTAPQLSGARTRARLIVRHRRRTRIATGSAALAATAGITAVATVGLPGVRAGAAPTQAGGIANLSAVPSTVPSAVPTLVPTAVPTAVPITPAPAASLTPTSTESIPRSPVPIVTAPTAPPTQPAQPTAVTTPAHPDTSSPTATPTLLPTDAPPATTQPPVSAEPPTMTAACTAEAARLRTTVEGSDYVTADPGSGVIAWNHPAGPLTTLVVDTNCAPFNPDELKSTTAPVQEITVQGFEAWLIGDAKNGHLELIWNADNATEVNVNATVAPGADAAAATKDLVKFVSTLVD